MLQACSDIDIFNIFMHTEDYKSTNTHNEDNGLLQFPSMVIATHQLIILYTCKSRNTIIICYWNAQENLICNMHLCSQIIFRKS